MKTRQEILAHRRALGLPHWRPSQRRRLAELLDQGVVHTCPGPLALCGPGALHATREPHRWRGVRVWIVAMHGDVRWDGDKCGALRREVLGEVLPEESWVSPSVAIRIGAYLAGADLYGADLSGANLSGAYRGASSTIPGWRTLATGYLERES